MSNNIEVKGLAHIGIPTSDLEKSIAFYQDLGFQIIVDQEEWRAIILYSWSAAGDHRTSQSLDETVRSQAGTKGDGNIDHFALLVDDLDKTKKVLEEKEFRLQYRVSRRQKRGGRSPADVLWYMGRTA
ncbi:VOC family protein [[Clostridium] hylemonae]|uniref:VOC family protein n=1 Tax=[Clostridium] hylemonae TaxID=89153 RepID=UPI0014792991|nr:VOC family protein [[Clostridium] hylemonae]